MRGRCWPLRLIRFCVSFSLTLPTNPIDRQAVVGNGKTVFSSNILLALLNGLINKLIHPTALHTEDMVVVLPLIELEHRMAALEIVTGNKPQTGSVRGR